MSRQTERHAKRAADKAASTLQKQAARRIAQRALLGRQSEREKAGFYEGRSVASVISPSRSRVLKRRVKKGKEFGRIIFTEKSGGREISYHATKGWRSFAA